MSLMASPSSLPSRNWSYDVFVSFHGPDVRRTLLSHLREQFKRNGITMFDDQEIERSATITPSLVEAIRESRISIVILSKKYASSSWCLDELVEIFECKRALGQVVMTIFYGVEPSDVRKQAGEFGITFNKACACKTNKERQTWRKALIDAGNIAGEDFLRWDNEANMIKKIARDVSDKLNATPSRDFDGMVGLEGHLRVMEYLLKLDNDGVKMVAITGPAGIGKTTIARALQSRLANRFQLVCFVDNLRGSYYNGLEELRLQEQFLSKVLNQDGIRICHSGVIEERLCKQRVLVILDDVNHIKQLEAMANETTWFGPGSRVVVTTENKELLQQHGINNTYHVGFPSYDQAFKILCRYAFKQSYPHNGFENLANEVTELCGNLPLGLRVVGSSLRGKNEDEWEEAICRLETILDHQDIEQVLRIGFESLHEYEQSLFLHIAVFFNYTDGHIVNAMFADNKLDVKHGLKILVNRSLIYISNEGKIVMHKLLQQVGRQAINRQEPWKRSILLDAQEICDVLEDDKGTRAVSGISFDISDISEVSISANAFKRISNLRFLEVYKRRHDDNDRMHIPEEMEFPRRLRLLDWQSYPSKRLPPAFRPEYLVKLNMQHSQLEYLWKGTKPLTNLKELNLAGSRQLKELPDLSTATALEILSLGACESLVEIPSSFSYLHNLQDLYMGNCRNLQVIPAHMNLASLETVHMNGCSRLENIPVISTNTKRLYISDTAAEDVSALVKLCSGLEVLHLCSSKNVKELTYLPRSLISLNLQDSDVERIPDCIKDLDWLINLDISGSRRLASLPELPRSLEQFRADDCEALETIVYPWFSPHAKLSFTNCFKLDQQTRRAIIQRSSIVRDSRSLGNSRLPGSEVPAEFDYRAKGTSLTIHLDFSKPLFIRFKVCIVVSAEHPSSKQIALQHILCRRIVNGDLDPVEEELLVINFSKCRKEHLVIPRSDWQYFHPAKGCSEVVLEFRSKNQDFDIVGCGAQIFTQEITKMDQEPQEAVEDDTKHHDSKEGENLFTQENSKMDQEPVAVEDYTEHNDSKEGENLNGRKLTDCWSWIFPCFSRFVRNMENRS